jgi:serine phosphatase RsbU (regulator of sigma subunit)/CBS domain-containing protein
MAEEFLTVREVMQPDAVTVSPECPLGEALDLMNGRRIGAVLVVRPDGTPAGIFTERDLLRRVSTSGPGWRGLPVSEWMTPDPHTIGPEVGWDEAVGMMDRLRVRHLPVVAGGRVVGILSTRLLMRRRTEHLDRLVADRTGELKRANDELLARDAEQMYNLRAAGRFQTRLLLPNAPPAWPELRWGMHYAPLDHLGGDYYDFAQPDPDHLGFLIADASGHSIAAAMVAILSRTAFTEVSRRTASPGQVLGEMNRRLQDLADERFVTAFYGVLDRRTRVLTYANAGHPHPLRRSASGEIQPLAASGFMLGVMPDEQYRERTVELLPGDRLCFYTDGLVEARNEIGETFGVDRLTGCVREHGAETAEELAGAIIACQRAFRGAQLLSDDVTLVVADLGPAPALPGPSPPTHQATG